MFPAAHNLFLSTKIVVKVSAKCDATFDCDFTFTRASYNSLMPAMFRGSWFHRSTRHPGAESLNYMNVGSMNQCRPVITRFGLNLINQTPRQDWTDAYSSAALFLCQFYWFQCQIYWSVPMPGLLNDTARCYWCLRLPDLHGACLTGTNTRSVWCPREVWRMQSLLGRYALSTNWPSLMPIPGLVRDHNFRFTQWLFLLERLLSNW